ncbi:MAG: G8 domain-containing protein [Actinomycetota bacterium]
MTDRRTLRRIAALVVVAALVAACAGTASDSPSSGGLEGPTGSAPTDDRARAPAPTQDHAEHDDGEHAGELDDEVEHALEADDQASEVDAGGQIAHDHDVGEHRAVMALVDPAAATHVAVASGNWSSPATWDGEARPTAGSRVHVPADVTVTVDRVLAEEIRTVRIDGTLRFDPNVDTSLRVDTLVSTPTGALEIGTPSTPVSPEVTARVVFTDDGPIDRAWDPTLLSRGAILHGATVIHGSEKRAFVAVSEFPMAGDDRVRLTDPPSGWRVGDQIVVAGTDPDDPMTDERRTIVAIDGDVVRLDASLALNHDAPRPDLEVHVANLTRNVVFSSEGADVARRGHVMIMHTNAASIDFAWFRGLGRSDKARGYDDIEFIDLSPFIPAEVLGGDNVRGRYSLHFHRGGTDPGSEPAPVNGSVVSDDPGWGFVNHSSHVAFSDNVAYDIVGAAYYTEAGDEIGSFTDNIAIRIVNPNLPLRSGVDGEEFDPDAREGRQDYGFQGDGMWLHSPNVRVEGNVFSGISGHALIVWPEGLLERAPDGSTVKAFHDTANVPGGELIGPPGTRMQIMDVPIGSFTGNQAYSVTRGVQLYYLHTEFFGDGLHYEDCTVDPPAEYDAQLRSTFSGSTIWNVGQVAFAAPYTNRITVEGLRIVGDGSSGTIGIDIGHFMNERGIEVDGVTVEGFDIGVRVSATADVRLTGASLSNGTDVQYVIPDEDGADRIVDGPLAPDIDDIERDNSHLETCIPGQPSAHHEDADDEDEFDEDGFDDDEFDEDGFDEFEDED